MKLTLNELLLRTQQSEMTTLSREFFPGTEALELPTRLNEFNEACDVIKTLMTSHLDRRPQGYGLVNTSGKELMQTRERGEVPLLSFKEALMSNDASIIFKRVISDVLLQPTESPYIGQDILAKKVVVDGVRNVTFPTMGAIRAGWVTETGEYPQQSPSFGVNQLELRVKKVGLALAIGQDVIEDSMWDIFGLYVSMARDAMKRFKEEQIFNTAIAQGHKVFDNAGLDPAGYTTGRDIGTVTTPGALNGSLTMLDILDAAGALIANGYSGTDLIIHPLAWVMLAKDPRLLFHGLQGGYNQSIPTPGIDSAAISKFLPWGSINVVVSPQVPFKFHTSITMNGTGTTAANTTDMILLDRKQSLMVLQRDEMHMEEFDHPERDIHMMRVGERYAVGALDGGRSIATIRNVRLVQNHLPVFSVGQAAPL